MLLGSPLPPTLQIALSAMAGPKGPSSRPAVVAADHQEGVFQHALPHESVTNQADEVIEAADLKVIVRLISPRNQSFHYHGNAETYEVITSSHSKPTRL